jgi:hypothetical protein
MGLGDAPVCGSRAVAAAGSRLLAPRVRCLRRQRLTRAENWASRTIATMATAPPSTIPITPPQLAPTSAYSDQRTNRRSERWRRDAAGNESATARWCRSSARRSSCPKRSLRQGMRAFLAPRRVRSPHLSLFDALPYTGRPSDQEQCWESSRKQSKRRGPRASTAGRRRSGKAIYRGSTKCSTRPSISSFWSVPRQGFEPVICRVVCSALAANDSVLRALAPNFAPNTSE